MKMTKIESARIIVGQKGRCPVTLKCKTCFTKNGVCGSVENRLALAEAYIKRHESKTKKKDHILDTTKKAEEPKPIKEVGIDNSDVTLALTAQHEPVKDCPVNSEIPQPVKFEDEVPFNLYTVTEYGIFRFTALRFHSEKTKEKNGTTITKEKVFAFEGDRKFDGTKKEVTIDINNCYKTLEEAVIVAKKLWNGEGK